MSGVYYGGTHCTPIEIRTIITEMHFTNGEFYTRMN